MTVSGVTNEPASPRTSGVTYPLPEAVRRMLAPRERISVSHWCDRHRYLDRRFTAQPGPWRTARVPYLREPLDAIAETGLEVLVFMKCSRVGGTEWQNNAMAWSADVRPMPTLYVQPERDDVADELTGRIRSLFEASSRLRAHIPGGEWCSKTQIDLDAMTIYGGWAANQNTLIRKTIGLAIFDEIDNTEKAAGHLGNTLDVLAERLATYGHRGKLMLDATPTVPAASGWRTLEASDFRRPHVACPFCGTYQVLVFDQLKMPEDVRDPDRIADEQLAWYECAHCEAAIDHASWHQWMIDRVVWIPKQQRPIEALPVSSVECAEQTGNDHPEQPEHSHRGEDEGETLERARLHAADCTPAEARDIVDRRSLAVPPYDPWDERYAQHVQWTPALEGTPPRTARRGYWINVLYSPWATRTWPHIMAEWLRRKDDPERRRVFFNSWLGEPYEEAVHVTDVEQLAEKRAGELPRDWVPPEARVLTMGCDVQLATLYYVIRAWGPSEESWLIREGTIEQFWHLYELAFHTGFPIVGLDGQRMRCRALGIDSGYAARLDEVYEFGRRPGVVLMKGVQSADYRTRPSKIEHMPRGGTHPLSLILHHVNTHLFKEKVHRLANVPPGQPGHWHLHSEATDEYLKQFTAEKQVLENVSGKRGGRRQLVWKPKTEGAPNHFLDCEVYAAALADILSLPLLTAEHPRQEVLDASGEPAPGSGGGQKDKPPRRRGHGGAAGGGFGGFVQ